MITKCSVDSISISRVHACIIPYDRGKRRDELSFVWPGGGSGGGSGTGVPIVLLADADNFPIVDKYGYFIAPLE